MTSFTCPRCGATSHHPVDVREGYCGRCHDWTGKIQTGVHADGGVMTDPTTLLRAMIEGDAEVRAMVAEVLGVQPWPYDNLVLRTPHCPRCGARAQMLVGEYIEPIAMCPEHDCAIFNWDPTKPAELLLATSKVMIKRALPDGGTVMEPHEPDCALAVPHPDDVTPTCTCSERQETT